MNNDLISRSALIADLSEKGFLPAFVQRAIERAPAADVAPVRNGRWDGEGDGYADGEIVLDVWYCSACGHCIDDGTDDPYILPNYCPNCGAKMDSEEC